MNYEGLFIAFAEMAITAKYEIELEKKDYDHNHNTLGSLIKNSNRDNGLIFTARPVMPDVETDPEDEEEEDEE